jgi:hypothetical protein
VSILSPIERSADCDANVKVNSFVLGRCSFLFFFRFDVNVEAASADRTRRHLQNGLADPENGCPRSPHLKAAMTAKTILIYAYHTES